MTKEWKIFLSFLFYSIILSLFLKAPISGGSSYSPSPKGTEAFFEFLKKDNKEVLRWEESILQLSESELPNKNTLLLISPKKTPPLKPLLDWVEKGNNLLFFLPKGGYDDKLLSDIGLDIDQIYFPKNDILAKNKSTKIVPICESGASRNECLQIYPWLREVENINKSKYFFILENGSKGKSKKYFKDGKASLLIKSFENGVLKDGDSFALALKNHGKGVVYLLPDASIIQNSNIDKADNFKMLYQLLQDAGDIYFDEFSHGFKKPLEAEVKSQVLLIKITIAILFIILSLAALSRAIRFGKPLIETPPVQDASLDLIRTRGELYKKHFASSALIDYIKVWKERLGEKKNISSNLENNLFLETLFSKINIDKNEQISIQNSLEILSKASDGNINAYNYEKEVSNLEKIFRF